MTYDWDICVKVGAGAEIGAIGIMKYVRLIEGWVFYQLKIP